MSINMRKFIPLTKVDEASHTVYGLVTAESPDKEGEICDYDAAKVAYQTWSAEFEKATSSAGQEISYGNIRLQHTITPGGKVAEPVTFDDASKSILLKSTPIDDDVWEKLKRGFFTGYSQGGDYAWRKCDECGTTMPSGARCPACKKNVLVRYAPVIAEVSYVDNPCHGDAHFELVKADGTKELCKFQTSEEQIMEAKTAPGITPEQIQEIVKSAVAIIQQQSADTKAQKTASVKAWMAKNMTAILEKQHSGAIKKGMYDVAQFAAILCDLAYLQRNAAWEAAYEEDASAMPGELHALLEQAAESFLAMAEEEVEELTAAPAEITKTKGAVKVETKTATLSKAASAKQHIAKMKKAVSDHNEKMTELNKAHTAEMDEHFAKLHKILGVEEADAAGGSSSGQNEPEPVNVAAGAAKTFSQADLDKAVADATQKVAQETADSVAQQIIKALKGDDAEPEKPEVAKAAIGIGERTQMPTIVAGAGPVVRVMPVSKTQDAQQPTVVATADLDPATVRKAHSGDHDSVLKFMKSSTPQEGIPVTLAAAVGKIRH